MRIRETTPEDLAVLAVIVSESNKDVALKFGLDAGNCPKHPSFCTADWVRADVARGERYFVIEEQGRAIGCVAYERPRADTAYLNRLSVLPEHRRRGIGERLVRFIAELAQREGVGRISIGVIGEHDDLQRWYRKLGFMDGDLKRFAHLPFTVRYMACAPAACAPVQPQFLASAPS